MSTDTELLTERLRASHRKRRYAIKLEQKIDRALESYVRLNYTEWHPSLDPKVREKFNKEAKALITAAAKGSGEEDLIFFVQQTEVSRAPWDSIRGAAEKAMAKLAVELPVWSWVESVRGAGALGSGHHRRRGRHARSLSESGEAMEAFRFRAIRRLRGIDLEKRTLAPTQTNKG